MKVKVHSALEGTLHPAVSFVVNRPMDDDDDTDAKGTGGRSASSIVLGDSSITFFSDKYVLVP